MKRLLVTGATGALGTEVMRLARTALDCDVVGCSSRGDAAAGVIPWDLRDPAPSELAGPWDAVIHTAACTRWSMTADEAWDANVRTTEGIAAVLGPTTRLIHVSTAFATGLDGSHRRALSAYRNSYEWSKAASERVASRLSSDVVVVRPPLIIGTRATGEIARFSGLFLLLRALLTGAMPAIVANPDGLVEIVPVDDVALCTLEQAIAPPDGRRVVVLGCGSTAPTVRAVVDATYASLNDWRQQNGADPVPQAPYVAPSRWARFHRPFIEDVLPDRYLRIITALEQFHPYLTIEEPMPVTRHVFDVLEPLRRSVQRWADCHPRLALAEARQWHADRPGATA